MAYDTDGHTSDHTPPPLVRRPVTDWAGDWDWLDPAWGAEAPEIWQSLREPGATCRVHRALRKGVDADRLRRRSPRWPTTPSTSRRSASRYRTPIHRCVRRRRSRPTRPSTMQHRRLLLRAFSPKAVDPLTGRDPSILPRADRAPRRAGRSPMPLATTPSTSRCISSPTWSVCPSPMPTCSATWIFRNFQLGPIDPALAKVQLQQDMADDLRPPPRRPRAAEPADDLAERMSPRPRSTASRCRANCNAATCRC